MSITGFGHASLTVTDLRAQRRLVRNGADLGLLDEIYVSLVPVLLVAGIPFFAVLERTPVLLDDPEVISGPPRDPPGLSDDGPLRGRGPGAPSCDHGFSSDIAWSARR